jgi:hypothetical protein
MYRPATGLARLTMAAFVLYATVLVLAMIGQVDRLLVAVGGEWPQRARAEAMEGRLTQLKWISAAVLGLCALAFSLWTYRVARNARTFGGPLRTPPGLAVGYHFIPIVNLWKPVAALSEIWIASDPEAHPREGQRISRLLIAWWIAWLVSRFAFRLVPLPVPRDTYDWSVNIWIVMASLVLDAIALAFAALVVARLTRRQEQRAAYRLAPARLV